MSGAVDVLAVMDRTIQLRAGFLPTNGASDLCGKIPADLENPITAAFIERHREAVEARAAVAELVAASEALRAEWDRQDNGKFDAMPAKDFFAAEARWRAALAKFQEGA